MSPDGKIIRLSVSDTVGTGSTLWETNVATGASRPLLPEWNSSTRPMTGRWTEDGRYFLFSAVQDGLRNIWTIRDVREIWRKSNHRPVQLTAGPGNFFQPLPSKDGKTIFAVGEVQHGQLMRYNQHSHEFEPFAGDFSADQAVFSLDAKWMAYIQYPEGNLWRSRVDGSDRQQITFPPLRAYYPHWSPDGRQIAFVGILGQTGQQNIFIISADGGSPRLIAPELGLLPTAGTWSSEGLLLSAANAKHPNAAMYRWKVDTGLLELLPGSDGLDAGMESPDGEYIASLTRPEQKLVLYNLHTHSSKTVAKRADYPAWSPDGRSVYFCNTGWGGDRAYYRLRVADGAVERLFGPPTFPVAGVYGIWSGLAPDGSLLIFRSTSTRDVYALDVQLP
jgi:Tol biopolymer transport system component